MKAVNHTGQRFGRLVVERQVPSVDGKATWLCRCDCGSNAIITGDVLRRGRSKSCGCYRKAIGAVRGRASKRHGEGSNGKESREYNTWSNMKSRCRNPNHQLYRLYGGRGITICDRWLIYENFLADMGRRPEGLTLDRIDVNGNYEPSNCRWATAKQQARNQRGNRWIKIHGVRKTLAEWLELTGQRRRTFYVRIAQGMNNEAALFTPPRLKNGKPRDADEAKRLKQLLQDIQSSSK